MPALPQRVEISRLAGANLEDLPWVQALLVQVYEALGKQDEANRFRN